MMPHCNTEEENKLVLKARGIMSVFDDMAEMIRLGAYRKGSDPAVDEAIKLNPKLEAFLSQSPREHTTLAEGYKMLADILEPKEATIAQ